MADTKRIKTRGGTLAELRTILLDTRELGVTTDTKEVFFGASGGNNNLVDKNRIYMPVDYGDKPSGLNFFKKLSGAGTLTIDATQSAMGTGCFSVSANGGQWLIERFYPVAPLFGVGGHVVIKGAGLFSVGLKFYDINKNEIVGTAAQNGFIVNGVVGTGGFVAHKNYLIDEGTGANNFPVGTRFIKPWISVSSNAVAVKFDAFIVYPSGFAILPLYV